jgi:hypothetical protein
MFFSWAFVGLLDVLMISPLMAAVQADVFAIVLLNNFTV